MNTGFSDLPITVQLDILDLCFPIGACKKLKNIRLVNKVWRQLVMFMDWNDLNLQRLKFIINNESLDIFSKLDHTTPFVGELQCERITKPLPIWSSTRIKLPQTQCLTICNGISTENILKLLRYYVGNCTSLTFKGTCFQHLNPYQISSGLQINNIKTLEFKYPFKTQSFDPYSLEFRFEINQHTRNLTELLKKTKFPSLTNFIWKSSGNFVLTDENSNKIVRGVVSFLKEHGQQLKSLEIDKNRTYDWNGLIQCLQYLTHLEKLKLSSRWGLWNYSNLPIPTDFRQSLSSLKTLNQLKLCVRGTSSELEFVQCLLANNSRTLRSFRLDICGPTGSGYFQNLEFLYSNPNLKLTELQIVSFENRPEIFHVPENFKLLSVKYLTFYFRNFYNLGFFLNLTAHLPWKEKLVMWITQIFPNLEKLDLTLFGYEEERPDLEPQYISTLIQNLPKLTKMNLKLGKRSFWNDAKSKNLVSTESEQWIFQNYPKSFAVPSPVNSMGCKLYTLYRELQP